mgnify:CR=1 FL=1
MSQQLEIHLNDSICKVYQGNARRVFYSTEEAVALALLKIKPTSLTNQVQWADFMAGSGIAFGVIGNKTITLIQSPARTRTIHWEKLETSVDLTVDIPPLLWAIKMIGPKLVKTQLWLVRNGFEQKLSVISTDACLHYFPYGNVYSHGGVCWGHVEVNAIKHPSEVEETFFKSSFNNDLWAPLALSITDARLPDLVQKVKTKLPVPPAASYTKSVVSVIHEMVK